MSRVFTYTNEQFRGRMSGHMDVRLKPTMQGCYGSCPAIKLRVLVVVLCAGDHTALDIFMLSLRKPL